MVFKTMKEQKTFSLSSQEKNLMEFGTEELEDLLENMLVTLDEFVVLTAPKAQGQQIRYVQARAKDDSEIKVELGVEESDGTHLYYKICEEEECFQIFLDFFEGRLKVKMDEFQPVQF